MKEAHAILHHNTNYLIQLFYKTDQKYSCTKTKIGKLLSILAFKYAVKEIELFDEKIYRYPKCGTLIKELGVRIPLDVYRRDFDEKDNDGKKMISVDELKHGTFIPKSYRDISMCYSWEREAIEDLFLNFGAYSTSDLADELNPIVEYKGICEPDGSINLEAIAHLDKNQFPNNKVVEYIFK